MLVAAPVALKIVFRLFDSEAFGAGGGGGTEKSARSCDSVSRISVVMSCERRSAFVKTLGGGNLPKW